MRTNKLTLMISMILLIAISICFASFVSASAISVSPSSIAFNIYPGENITKNITITTSGDYAVYLSYEIKNNNSPVSLQMNYTSPLIVENTAIVPVLFKFGKDSPNETFNIIISASTEQYDYPSSGDSGYSGGGGVLYKYWNGTGWTITKPNYTNEPIILGGDKDEWALAINQSDTPDEIDISHLNWFQRFWNWLKSLFRA